MAQLTTCSKNKKLESTFMMQFDKARNWDIASKSNYVNTVINNEIRYKLTSHWQTPVETIKSRTGDCKAYALLKYAALEYLGVPESRMDLVDVNSNGSRFEYADHQILAVNVSPFKQPEYLVYSNGVDVGFFPESTSSGFYYDDAVNKKGVWGNTEHIEHVKRIENDIELGLCYTLQGAAFLYLNRPRKKKPKPVPANKNKVSTPQKKANGPRS